MALIKCNGCGHMVSDKGTKCPKCGTPIHKVEEAAKPIEEKEKVIAEVESPKVDKPKADKPINESQKDDSPISESPKVETEALIGEYEDEPQRQTWKKVCAFIIFAAIIIGGIYFYMDRQNKAQLEKEVMLKAKADSAMVADSLARVTAAKQARLDSIKKVESINAAMPIVEDFISSYYDNFQGVRNKYIKWGSTENAVKALTAKGYKVKNIETEQVEGEGGEYETIITTILCFIIEERDSDIQYYKITIEDGYCGGITIEFHDEDFKKDFVMKSLKYGFVKNSESLVNGNNDDMLVWTLKGEDGQLWIEDGSVGDLTISISEKKVRLNRGCI